MKTLVCSRADAPLVVPGSIFTRKCGRCGSRVMIAPSGQQFLKRHQGSHIWCDLCFFATAKNPRSILTAATLEEVRREASEAVPNLWNKRN